MSISYSLELTSLAAALAEADMAKWSAAGAFEAIYRLQALRRQSEVEGTKVDVLVTKR